MYPRSLAGRTYQSRVDHKRKTPILNHFAPKSFVLHLSTLFHHKVSQQLELQLNLLPKIQEQCDRLKMATTSDMLSIPSDPSRPCDCFDPSTMAKLTSGQFQGPGLKILAASSCRLLAPRHHALRKSKQPLKEPHTERNRGPCPRAPAELPANRQDQLNGHVSRATFVKPPASNKLPHGCRADRTGGLCSELFPDCIFMRKINY